MKFISQVTDATHTTVGSVTLAANVGAAVLPFRRISKDSSRNISSIELSWQVPLSVFKVDHALPTGRYELILNPLTASTYRKAVIESFAC